MRPIWYALLLVLLAAIFRDAFRAGPLPWVNSAFPGGSNRMEPLRVSQLRPDSLMCGTTYHFRVVAGETVNPNGFPTIAYFTYGPPSTPRAYGPEGTFTTTACTDPIEIMDRLAVP